MGNFNSNTAKLTQEVTNNILQSQSSSCNVENVTNTSGNVIITTGSSVGQFVGINVGQQNANASCLISNSMDSQIATILESQLEQSIDSATDIFSFLSINKAKNNIDLRQAIANNITQIANSTCQAKNIVNTTNNYVVAVDTNTKGFIGVNIGASDANASCTMNNLSKLVVYNQQQGNVKQETETKGTFATFASMFAMFGVILVLGIVLVIVLFSTGAFSSILGGAKGGSSGSTSSGGLTSSQVTSAILAGLK